MYIQIFEIFLRRVIRQTVNFSSVCENSLNHLATILDYFFFFLVNGNFGKEKEIFNVYYTTVYTQESCKSFIFFLNLVKLTIYDFM